jgi:hypothetical protein
LTIENQDRENWVGPFAGIVIVHRWI